MLNKKAIAIISILGILSLCVLLGSLVFSHRHARDEDLFAKPRITKDEALRKANELLESFGINSARYPHKAVEFSTRNWETLYLLKTFGAQKVKELLKDENAPYAFWSIRWSGIADESLKVDIDSFDGRIINYDFQKQPSVEEKITNLAEAQAKELAVRFLSSQSIDVSALELVVCNKTTHTIQEEYYLKWLYKDKKLGEAVPMITLAVKGDKIARYFLGLELPESYRYEYKNNYFLSGIWSGVASGFSMLLGIVLVVLAVVRRKGLPWKRAKLWAVVLGGVFTIHFLNAQASYPWYIDILFKLLGALFLSLVMYVLIPVTEVLFRESFHKGLYLSANEKGTRGIWASLVFCYSLTFVSFLAVGLVFGALGHFKIAWDVGGGAIVSEILTSKIVYFAPFLLGIIPAFTEEFFRGFVMALGKRVSKSNFIAIVVSAFLWGFGHTVMDGSFYPGYIAGFEKFIHGILVGYILLYFGIEVSIAWHFLNNFLATNLCLFYLGNAYESYALFLSVSVIAPFVVALLLYFRKPRIPVT